MVGWLSTVGLSRFLLGGVHHLRTELSQLLHVIALDWAQPSIWTRAITWAWHYDRGAVIALAAFLIVSATLLAWAGWRLFLLVVMVIHRIKQGAGLRHNPCQIVLGQGDGRPEWVEDDHGRRRISFPAGDVYLPPETEASHILIAGKSGAGKTQLFFQTLNALDARRATGDDARAVVLDLKGDFLQHYYRSGDAIFNPLDVRCVDWCPFAELRPNTLQIQSDLDALAVAIVPPNPRAGPNQFFDESARAVLRELLEAIYLSSKNPTNADLQRVLFGANHQEINRLLGALELSQTRGLFAPGGDERARSNVWATLMSRVRMFRLLDPRADRESGFSFRRWGAEGRSGQWLFLARRENDEELLGDQYATLVSLAAAGQMSVRDDQARPVHYILDELAQAGTVIGLERILTFGRSKKASAVMGIQSATQLVKRYGRETAATVIGNAGTLAILRQGDMESAELFADLLGKKRAWRTVHSHNESDSGTSSGVQRQRFEEYIYTPTNLLSLRGLSKSKPGRGLVRSGLHAGKHPRPWPIRVVYMRDLIPAERVPDFVPGGEEIEWTPEAVGRRQGVVRNAQARVSDLEVWERMKLDAKRGRTEAQGGGVETDLLQEVLDSNR